MKPMGDEEPEDPIRVFSPSARVAREGDDTLLTSPGSVSGVLKAKSSVHEPR